MFTIAKRIVEVIAILIVGVALVYFLDPTAFFGLLGANPYLYAGIMMAGGFGFAVVALRVLVTKTESWYALLEGVMVAAAIAAYVISREGNQNWNIPMLCALATCAGCVFLRFYR